MLSVNFDAAGLLADIIPNKNWEYCGWCYKPRISSFDIEQNKHAENVLKSLGCIDQDHFIPPPFNHYLETALLSYVFPYSDEILYVKVIHDTDYKDVLSSHNLTWDEGRDRLLPMQQLLLWTYKSVGHYTKERLTIVPRHPTLNLSFL